ncbi:MAG: peptide-methionine (S)-S-oxide reductase MsrA [Spirochaetales bacterium]|nr:peptide-methionine (S)-S-oxide reductase MsrA [Spirochaetales bacterium]
MSPQRSTISRGRDVRRAALTVLFLLFPGFAFADFPNPPAEKTARSGTTETAVLAGGCFWGMEGVFERLKGVTNVVSGYSGGRVRNPSYELVSSGTTGHAESIEITFDPSVISYGTLLKVFFSVAHNPTELNFQGPDHGTQYRSAVFYTGPEQKKVAEQYIRTLDKAKVFPSSIVTQVVPFNAFYPAEAYHQDFMDRNPTYPYIVFWDKPKVADLERMYPGLLQKK